MLELFRNEVDGQVADTDPGFAGRLNRIPPRKTGLERLMRAAHSVKGAARMVNLEGAVRVAHAMEDCFRRGTTGRHYPTVGRRRRLAARVWIH